MLKVTLWKSCYWRHKIKSQTPPRHPRLEHPVCRRVWLSVATCNNIYMCIWPSLWTHKGILMLTGQMRWMFIFSFRDIRNGNGPTFTINLKTNGKREMSLPFIDIYRSVGTVETHQSVICSQFVFAWLNSHCPINSFPCCYTANPSKQPELLIKHIQHLETSSAPAKHRKTGGDRQNSARRLGIRKDNIYIYIYISTRVGFLAPSPSCTCCFYQPLGARFRGEGLGVRPTQAARLFCVCTSLCTCT